MDISPPASGCLQKLSNVIELQDVESTYVRSHCIGDVSLDVYFVYACRWFSTNEMKCESGEFLLDNLFPAHMFHGTAWKYQAFCYITYRSCYIIA